jgi:hypothetical protein
MARRKRHSGNLDDLAPREVRITLDGHDALRLGVAAQIRGVTPSEFIQWALLPHLSFELPTLPDVELRALKSNENAPAGRGRGENSAA